MDELFERQLFDVHAAAKYLREIGASGVSVHTVRGLLTSGALPFLKLGKRFYVSKSVLDRWLKNHETRR